MIENSNQILFHEITEHLIHDEKPSEYINSLLKDNKFHADSMGMLQKLKITEQSVKYHPEGSVWNHTMLVLDEAAKIRNQSKDAKALMWAALLHDIGKPNTTRSRKGKITSYDHDIAGEKLCIEFLHNFTVEEEFIQKVAALVRYHMHMLYVLKELPYGDIKNMLKKVDIQEIAILSRCDRMGRTGVNREDEDAQYTEFLSKLKRLSVQENKEN